MSHELSSLTGAYAVDALDEQERALFDAHLATCADCAAEVRSLRAAAAELSHATAAAPPAELRSDVLTSVNRHRPLAPITERITKFRPRKPAQRWWPALAAACALITLAAAGWGYQQHQAANRAHAQASAITKVLDSPDARTVTGKIGGTGQATLVYSKTRHQLILTGHNIADPDSNKTYQLWMIDPNGAATSAALFKPDNNGNVLVQAAGNLDNTARMGVSIERAGGAPKPTPGAIVAVMTL
jgi:anti-sigma-K factor RskA